MLKKRLIFTLLYQNRNFYLSRNFRLQKIGDINWLKKNYNFTLLTRCVDEIILLDVSRDRQNLKDFINVIKSISENCFIPLSVGGKIDTLDKAKHYMDAGADKLVVNTSLLNLRLIKSISKTFGEQCLIGALDYKNLDKKIIIYTKNGMNPLNIEIDSVIKKINEMPVGEIILNSMDRDGTGFGFDYEILKHINIKFKKPVIFSGGAGNYIHLLEAFKNRKIDSIATANLLNFVGNGLQDARDQVTKNGISLAKWQNFKK